MSQLLLIFLLCVKLGGIGVVRPASESGRCDTGVPAVLSVTSPDQSITVQVNIACDGGTAGASWGAVGGTVRKANQDSENLPTTFYDVVDADSNSSSRVNSNASYQLTLDIGYDPGVATLHEMEPCTNCVVSP
jgi:hypothetical protein